MSTPISVRFPDEVARRLRQSGAGTGEATSGLVVRLVDEGIRMAEHPGVVFRDGPTGRRAGLAAGPDVWEIIVVLRDYAEGGATEAVRRTAKWLGITEAQARTAPFHRVPSGLRIRAAASHRVSSCTSLCCCVL